MTGDPTGLYAGATADVSIIVKQLNDVTEVPTAAISYSTSGQATVTEVVNGAHVVKDVTVGAAENGETQITSGVSAGRQGARARGQVQGPTGGAGGILVGGTGAGGFGGERGGGFGGSSAAGAAGSPSAERRRRHLERRWWRMTVTPPQGTPPVGVPERRGDRAGAGDQGLPHRVHLASPRCAASA